MVEHATDSPADGHVLGAQSDVQVRNDPDDASSALGFSGGDDDAMNDIDDPSDPDDASESVERARASAAPAAAPEGATAGAGTPGPQMRSSPISSRGTGPPTESSSTFFLGSEIL